MKSKTLLVTTAIITATTAAFGAASLRAPQIGGTATVTTPTATNTARAGTMRAQTMKTSSVSTPTSVTTTQSIATPVSTETTDARIALLKGIKGFNPGKIKDTTAATNELNAIDSRIEELQSKLDQAEAAADQTAKLTDVYTKEQVEAKIDEKISAIGTSISAKETYSKEEVDALLNDIKKKLPQLDDRGNMTWTDPNGNLVAHSLYYMDLVYTVDLKASNQSLTNFGTFYMYGTNKTDSAIQQYVSSTVCSGETSDWCWIEDMAPNHYINNGRAVSVVRLNHGYGLESSPIYWGQSLNSMFYDPETNDTTHKLYWTFEESPETYVKNAVCGNKPENECFIATGDMHAFMNSSTFPAFNHVGTFVEIVERGQHTGNNFNSNLAGHSTTFLTHNYFVSTAATVTDAQIYEYVNNFCNGDSDWWCYMYGQINTLESGTKNFTLIKRFPGYALIDSHIIHDNGEILFNKIFSTNEENPDIYIHDTICKDKPTSECYVAEYWDMITINNNIQPGLGERGDRYQVSVIEKSLIPGSGNSTPGYIPLRKK